MYCTDPLQGISLTRAKRQSEQVRHALTINVCSFTFDRSYARKRKTEVILCVIGKCVAQLHTLGGHYLDSLRVVVQIVVVEVRSRPPALRNDKTGLQH